MKATTAMIGAHSLAMATLGDELIDMVSSSDLAFRPSPTNSKPRLQQQKQPVYNEASRQALDEAEERRRRIAFKRAQLVKAGKP